MNGQFVKGSSETRGIETVSRILDKSRNSRDGIEKVELSVLEIGHLPLIKFHVLIINRLSHPHTTVFAQLENFFSFQSSLKISLFLFTF